MATAGGGGGGSEGDLVGWPNKPVSVLQLAREPQPEPEPGLKCPRCDSTNTKFCYFNNCSFSQPRHFCRACRHYWTRGGDLRNIPVGGGSRKSKRGAKPMDTTGAAGGMSSRSATSTAPSAATTSTCTGSATAATTSTCTGSATTAVPDGMHQ